MQMPDLYKTTRFSQTGFAIFLQIYRSIILPMVLRRGFHLILWAICILIATSPLLCYIALSFSLLNLLQPVVNGRSICHCVTPRQKAFVDYKKPSCKGSGYLAYFTCKEASILPFIVS